MRKEESHHLGGVCTVSTVYGKICDVFVAIDPIFLKKSSTKSNIFFTNFHLSFIDNLHSVLSFNIAKTYFLNNSMNGLRNVHVNPVFQAWPCWPILFK